MELGKQIMTETGILTDASPWISVEPAAWRPLTEGRTPRLFRKKTFLYTQGQPAEHFYIIQRGRACISTSRADGHEKQLYIAERGALCGESACLQRQPHASAALAIVDTWAYAVPRLAMLEALREDWALNQRFLELCFRKNTVLLGQVREFSFDQAERRIARTLLNLAAQYGRPCPEGVRISIRFTHQDVAGIINTSRITTNKVMKRMEEEGYSSNGRAAISCGPFPPWSGWRGERVSSAQPFRSPGRRGCLAGGCARSRRRWRR